ncbi:adenosylcobinamide-GDP ribazoletransferase [Ectothiorhodospiraceae bacterium WFHF3C12]|nr:adenosylcobinamide-GDP ribazoletransferase [Ectothiorhodospiraceae bacterium WFHF3C12]
MPSPLRLALQFLTRLPVHADDHAPDTVGRSLLWYPVVGALVGVLLLAVAALVEAPIAGAGIVLLAWVAVTGALHLDGLGDLADAWVGGHDDAERTLAIMKDIHAGPMAVAAIAAVLIAKFAAVAALLGEQGPVAVLFAPILARAAVPVMLMGTPYVRSAGIGSAMAENLPRKGTRWMLGITAAIVLLALGWDGIAMILAALAVTLLLRRSLLKRIGGTTGDCLGALIELVEVAVLYAALV